MELGTLTGSKYHDIKATHFYQGNLQSDVLFKGVSWNLKKLYDHAEKRYSYLKRCEGKKLSPSQTLCWENKRLLVASSTFRTCAASGEIQRGPEPAGSGELLSLSFLCPSDPSQSSTEGEPPREALGVSQTSTSSAFGSPS